MVSLTTLCILLHAYSALSLRLFGIDLSPTKVTQPRGKNASALQEEQKDDKEIQGEDGEAAARDTEMAEIDGKEQAQEEVGDGTQLEEMADDDLGAFAR